LNKKADKDTIKFLNRQTVLSIIRKYNEISRADLTEKTKLSPTTISAITSELVENKLIREIRIGESNGGRPPLIFGINPIAAFSINLRVTPSSALVAIVNLANEIVYKKEIILQVYDEESLQELLETSIKSALDNFPYDLDLIQGIGISFPGLIDYKSCKIIFSASLHVKNFDVQQAIYKAVGKEVYIYKDTDALLLGEYHFGIEESYKDVIYILVENGVGMSYLYSGKLFRLPEGGFELGHITIDPEGELCRCGNKGCLGTMVSEIPAQKKLSELLAQGIESKVSQAGALRYEDMMKLYEEKDIACTMVINEQINLLGTAISNMVNIFNPELVILGGPLVAGGEELRDNLKNIVSKKSLKSFSQKTKLKLSALGDNSALLGMSHEIFSDRVYKFIDINNK